MQLKGFFTQKKLNWYKMKLLRLKCNGAFSTLKNTHFPRYHNTKICQ